MKNCVHVWISRNLTYAGKTLIVKNLWISFCGYEIETRRIQEKYVKKKINQQRDGLMECDRQTLVTEIR